jgi:hypothetical protein
LLSRPRKAHSGRNRSRSPSKRSGSARLAPHQSSASAAMPRNTSPGKCCSPGAELQARSPARRRHRRGRACRAGHGERRQRHQRSAVSGQAYPDTKARPPTASHGRPADRRRDSPVRKRRYSALPPARPSRRFLASSTTCVNRRYGARPGRRGWLCEPRANGHSVAPANRRACSRCWPGPRRSRRPLGC